MLEVEKGLYTWIVDQIQLEEATSGQVVASTYIKPFEDKENEHGIPIESIVTVDVNEIIAFIAQFFEISFAPAARMNASHHMQFDRMSDDNKKMLRRALERKKVVFQNMLQAEPTIEHPEVF